MARASEAASGTRSPVFTDDMTALSAPIQPNAPKLIGCWFKVQMDNNPKHPVKDPQEWVSQGKAMGFFIGQVSQLISLMEFLITEDEAEGRQSHKHCLYEHHSGKWLASSSHFISCLISEMFNKWLQRSSPPIYSILTVKLV